MDIVCLHIPTYDVCETFPSFAVQTTNKSTSTTFVSIAHLKQHKLTTVLYRVRDQNINTHTTASNTYG